MEGEKLVIILVITEMRYLFQGKECFSSQTGMREEMKMVGLETHGLACGI